MIHHFYFSTSTLEKHTCDTKDMNSDVILAFIKLKRFGNNLNDKEWRNSLNCGVSIL